jgi:hypothetical protein
MPPSNLGQQLGFTDEHLGCTIRAQYVHRKARSVWCEIRPHVAPVASPSPSQIASRIVVLAHIPTEIRLACVH